MRKRAEDVEQTRQRIVDAAVHMHSTVGPAATTIAALAEHAGVTRLTVYRHFPDAESLFAACGAEWFSRQVPPDPEAWKAIADPAARLRAGLADLYRFYRDGEPALARIRRDLHLVPASLREHIAADERRYRDTLLKPFAVTGARRRRLRAVLGHAVAFGTWRSLCVDNGMSNADAVDTMARLARHVTNS